MAQIGLTKAAEITGKAASTITRRTKHKDANKRLGFTLNGDGEKLYDIAELERVFGKLKTPSEDKHANENAIVRNSQNANERNNLQQQLNNANEAKNTLFQEKIDILHTQLEETRNDRDKWQEQANKLLLTYEADKKTKEQGSNNKALLWLLPLLTVLILALIGFSVYVFTVK